MTSPRRSRRRIGAARSRSERGRFTLGDVLRRATEHLGKTSETGRLDAELLLATRSAGTGSSSTPTSTGR